MKAWLVYAALFAAIMTPPPGASAQTPGGPIDISFGWSAADPPQKIVLPNEGKQIAVAGMDQASTPLMRPTIGERRYAVEVLYVDGTSYPLELRLLPISRPAVIQLSRNRPDSCSNNNLRPYETPTAGTLRSIRAAFSVQFMLLRETEANSCTLWPLRAQKARHDRYCNMMTASELLVVPESIRSQFRADARGNAAMLRAIADCEHQEGLRKTIVIQAAATDTANPLDAYIASAVLSEEAVMAEADPGVDAEIVYSQISRPALEQQTSDLRVAAARQFGEAAVLAVDQSIASEIAEPR